jgi:hypothetical protein
MLRQMAEEDGRRTVQQLRWALFNEDPEKFLNALRHVCLFYFILGASLGAVLSGVLVMALMLR